MSKNKQQKKNRKLRQSIEVLKAQLSADTKSEIIAKEVKVNSVKIAQSKIDSIDDNLIKKDLTKTIVLSAVGFAVILVLWSFNITSFNF